MKYVTKIILIMTCLIIMLPFGGCGRKKQVTAQKAGVLKPEAPEGSFGSWRGCG